ncbi:MAG: hypothetical protein HYZ27_06740 [Deltaproteobacteria bacterium]|nr:hypothetical protein [Deltaproteobacteria bacterium]
MTAIDTSFNPAITSARLAQVDDLTRQIALAYLGTGNTASLQQILAGSGDVFQLKAQATKVDTKGVVTIGDRPPGTAGPHEKYGHSGVSAANAAAVQGQYYLPAEQLGRVQLVSPDGKMQTKPLSGATLKKYVDERRQKDPAGAAEFIKNHGLVEGSNGALLVPVQSQSSALVANLVPGIAGNPAAASAAGVAQRTSWTLPVMGGLFGLMTGGFGGAAAGATLGFFGAKALKAASGGMSAGGLAPAFAGMSGAGVLSGLGSFGSWGGSGFMSTLMGMGGMEHHMRRQMASLARESASDSLIAMTQNTGIPIEDLIGLFMAHMGDLYDQKLREKIEETARAEKREEHRTRVKDASDREVAMTRATGGMAGMLGGALGMIPVVGQVAAVVGAGASLAANAKANMQAATTDAQLMMEDAVQGHTKSSTILMQEVQILMNKWKQVNELFSNLIKSLHDMAMTPIRNLR